MNYMSKVAEMLGVKMGERFKIEGNNKNFYINETGLTADGFKYVNSLLVSLLAGTDKIIKESFTSRIQHGDIYHCITMDGGVYNEKFNPNYATDIAMMYIGNMFETKEEALRSKDDVLAVLNSIKDNRKNIRTGDGLL